MDARPTVRVIAICVFSRGSRILLNEGRDPLTGSRFLRPLGGGVEFGETGAQAVRREIREELGAAVRDVCYLGTIENLFTFGGRPHHEVVLVYDGAFEEDWLRGRTSLDGRETWGQATHASWRELDDVAANLVPAGLYSFLRPTNKPCPTPTSSAPSP